MIDILFEIFYYESRERMPVLHFEIMYITLYDEIVSQVRHLRDTIELVFIQHTETL
jgi:hypothetical protein